MMKKLLLNVFLLLMMAVGAVAQNQLNEGFESTTFPPDDWTAIHVSGNNSYSRSTSYHNSGDACAYVNYASNGHENYLVTPKLVPAADEALTFYLSASSWSGTTLTVEVSTTTPTESAFTTTLATYTTGSSGSFGTTSLSTFVEKTITASELEAYVGQQIYIAFHVVDNDGSGICIDDVSGISLYVASCPKPATITANSITTVSADITWTAGGSESVWALKYGVAGFDVETAGTLVDNLSSTSYALTGLTANTQYDVYVKSVCSASDESDWKNVSFRTACDAITSFPWTENFDSYEAGNLTAPCWENEHISGGGSSIFRVYTYSNGANSTYQLQLPDMTSGTMTKLMLPEMNFGGIAHQFLIDVYRNASTANYTEGIRIYASSDGNIEGASELGFISRSYTTSDTEHGIPAESASGWYTYELNIPITGTCFIIIRGESQYGSSTFMDNFIVREAPSCVRPTTLAVSSITSVSADIAWIAGGSETAWALKYGVAGFDVETEGTLVENLDAATYALTGLTANTVYDVYVKSVCGVGEESEWNSISFRTECGIEAVPYSENFDSQTANQVPACWTKVGSGTAVAYSYSTNANSGSNYLRFSGVSGGNIIAMPQFGNEISGLQLSFYTRPESATNSNCGTFEVGYITDLNDASTFVAVESYAYNDWASATYVQKDIVMSTAPSGSYFAFNHKANSSSWYWFVDDVSVDMAPTCVRPTELAASNVEARTATLTWTAGADETAWQICVNGDEDNLINVTEPTYTFAGLTPETNYTVKVRANCGASSQSEWTANVSFTTAVSCPLPTGLTYTDITTTSATLSWTAGGSETEWALKYGVAGFDVETEGTLVENLNAATYELTGLNANTVYGVYVKAVCGAGDESAWRSGSFRTECGLEAVPYSENFDAQTTNQVPACWTKIGSGSAVVNNGYANSSPYSLKFSGVTNGNIIAMPQFGNEISGLQLSFYTRPESNTSSSCGTFEVGYITDLNDASTFVAVESYAYNDWASATYEQKDIVMSTAPSGSYFAFNHKANATYYYWFVDDVSVDMAPTCIKPIALAVSNIAGHTATLTWTAGSDETAWQICVNDDTDDLINVTEPTYTLTGLSPESNYTVKVRSNCGTEGESEWTANVAFTTTVACPAPADFALVEYTATTATLTWAAGEAGEWVLQYGTDDTFAENTEITVTNPTAELTGLTAETVHYARVKAVCGVDEESEWSSILSFEPTAKIVIGSGTATNSYLPTYIFYNYSLTQQIYTTEEIGTRAGAIQSLDFYTTGSATRSLDVYMIATDKESFSGSTDWITATAEDRVYSGSVTFAAGAWTTIVFDTPFNYDGTQNVAIIVDDNTGSYNSSIPFRVFDATSQALRIYNDNTNFDPASTEIGTGAVLNVKNQIRLLVVPPTYTITATAGENGTITPAEVTVEAGEDAVFTITPDAGYQIASVMVDTDNDVSEELEYNDGVYTYTFEDVDANHTIHATFEIVQTYTITVNITGNGNVVATDEDDNVYPMENGVVTVNNDDDVYLDITPAENYQIESVTVDGIPEELDVADYDGYTVILLAVSGNHTVDVTFVPADAADMIEAASMAIYPNPNNGMFSIDFSNIEGDATYEIIDARGAVVETRNINVTNGETMNFNHNLNAGTYFVRIIAGDKVYVEQIVVE